VLRGDDKRMRQILINLLSNAVKFTPEQDQVRISAFLTGESLGIAISDTGIGIASDQIPVVMEAFRQIDSKISRKYAGTGLELPLAKNLTELHGGILEIDNRVVATLRFAPEAVKIVRTARTGFDG